MGGDTVQTAVRNAPLLECLAGKVHPTPPMWMMRQAGRYLPEYRALRAEKGGFLELVYDSPSAAEITLQPLKRFEMDAAILFSDILIVPYAMGQNLQFLVGEGPHLSPTLVDHALESLVPAHERLDAIYETVRLVKADLAPEKAFLGFAGSAWTVATYMVNGEGSKDQHATRAYAYRDPQAFQVLIDAIVDLTITYLIGQIDAGVDAVQIFDSWSGSLSPAQFERWVIAPNARIAAAIHEARPGIPVIGFPKGAGEKLAAYARETGVDALGLDETIDPVWAAANIPAHMPVQGNLDPLALLAGGEQMESAVRHIIRTFEGRPHIFNLGHGILQQTPIEHVHALLTLVKQGA
ncbi:uroporphyrinogen decarboxylase [Blastomonas aquatica]|uniref:Uroporphyrinogen decarboxylase n=1 Tax=Blastomonas aquatica TaxID=1510276 RepID=A0ABQ1J003_9SPHN|nr:uroporphyrinogen decarboxylase [Blastomonas aquatica]GGB54588.1 uroporphyrinogen decarboxylase [Blastomonas aquatica]